MSYYLTADSSTHSGTQPHTPETPYPRFAGRTSGSRFFSPDTGRWLSQDPIGEEAFFSWYSQSVSVTELIRILEQRYAGNSYQFVRNASPNAVDFLGLREQTTMGAWYNYAGLGGVIRHHEDNQNLPPSDPSRKPNFNYIHYKLQCKVCEKATPQPSLPEWAPAPESQIIDYDSGDCSGKAGYVDLSIATRVLLAKAMLYPAPPIALDYAIENVLSDLVAEEFKYECAPCSE